MSDAVPATSANGGAARAPTGLEFAVVGAEPLEHTAAPGVRFHLHLTEPEGREVYTVALSTQVHIDPARRVYDDATRERLVELFGAPERWGATTHSFQWARVDALVPSFTGSAAFTLEVPCTYDLEVAAGKYFHSIPDGEVPLSFHFNGTVLYAGERDRLQVVLVPWSCSATWRMPISVWTRTIAAHYPGGGWIRLQDETLDALSRRKAADGLHSFDDVVRGLLESGVSTVLDAGLERLLTTLLYEGYALYPYTPGATKNATPTPFGIVYPPVYAAGGPHTFDRARMQLVLDPAAPDAPVSGTVAFLEPSGERHQGVERRVELGPARLDELAAGGLTVPFAFDAVQGRARLAAVPLEGGLVRVAMCVHNTTPVPEGLERAEALRASLVSTHLVAVAPGSRFASPVAPGPSAAAAVAACDHVNIFPVLAGSADDAVLGAAVVLPDHPRIAPESHGDLFDATEIEEALLLHVLALSEGERAAIAEQDPTVREMLARAEAAGPEQMARLRGRVTIADPRPRAGSAPPTSPARRGS